MVAHACNPSTFGRLKQADHLRLGVRDQPDQHGETPSLLNTHTHTDTQKNRHAPVVPAPWEAEAGNSLETRRRRLQWAEIVPLHSSLGNKSETPSQKKKEFFFGQAQWFTPVIPALWEAKTGRSPEVRSLRPDFPTWQNPVSTKNIKISWMWWHVPVIPGTLEAETGELLEPERQRLQ